MALHRLLEQRLFGTEKRVKAEWDKPHGTWLTLTLALGLCALLAAAARAVYRDYHAFLALGPGGTPPTFLGYLRVSFLRLFALRNPRDPSTLPHVYPSSSSSSSSPSFFSSPSSFFSSYFASKRSGTGSGSGGSSSSYCGGYFQLKGIDLPPRAAPAPTVAGIAPQRQTSQRASPAQYDALAAEIKALAARHPRALALGTSCFEKHGTGLFVRERRGGDADGDDDDGHHHGRDGGDGRDGEGGGAGRGGRDGDRKRRRRTCNGEACHAHPSDGSLHLTLHPDDARLVLARGRGERHPLARGGWLARFVPPGFVMVYAPRDAAELAAVRDIVKAAVWWVGDGEDCDDDDGDEPKPEPEPRAEKEKKLEARPDDEQTRRKHESVSGPKKKKEQKEQEENPERRP